MEKSALLKHLGQRLYIRYSIHSCVGTLVSVEGDIALLENEDASQIWIPCITSVSTTIPKPKGPSTNIPVNLLDLFK